MTPAKRTVPMEHQVEKFAGFMLTGLLKHKRKLQTDYLMVFCPNFNKEAARNRGLLAILTFLE